MTNFIINFTDANDQPIAVAHTQFFADAVTLAEAIPHCHIIDFHTGEVLRIYDAGNIIYAI